MTSIGNSLANTVWEYNSKMMTKPPPNAARYVDFTTVKPHLKVTLNKGHLVM